MSLQLMTKCICSKNLAGKIKIWIDSVSHTSLKEQTYLWLDDLKCNKEKIPRSAEINLHLSADSYELYRIIAEKNCVLLNYILILLLVKKEKEEYICADYQCLEEFMNLKQFL